MKIFFFFFFFFWKAIKLQGRHTKKTRSVGLAETQVFVLGLNWVADESPRRCRRDSVALVLRCSGCCLDTATFMNFVLCCYYAFAAL